MNDDGSGMAVVAGFPAEFSPSGEPSRQLHAGKRWFPGWQWPNIFALSDAGDVVSLEIDPQLEGVFSDPSWRVGDGSLSWIGRRLDGSGAVVEGGIYTTALLFDTLGNVTGAGSTELLVSLPLVDRGDGSIGPDIATHDWSPDGTQLVYDTRDRQLVIADLSTGTFDEIVTAGPMWDPQWSPAGDKLMVGYEGHGRGAVGVLNTDGSGMKLVEAGNSQWWRRRRLVADRQPSGLSACRPLLGRFLHSSSQVQRDREKSPYRRQFGIGIRGHSAKAPRLARPVGLGVRQCPRSQVRCCWECWLSWDCYARASSH